MYMYLSQNETKAYKHRKFATTDCMLNRNYIHYKGNEQPQGPNTVLLHSREILLCTSWCMLSISCSSADNIS